MGEIAVSTTRKKRRSRQNRRTSATRQKLLQAARKVFVEKGFDLTRIDEITEQADVGKGTFYNHFKSKEKLIRELISEVMGELTAEMEKKCGGITDLSQLLDKIIGVHIEFFSNRWEDYVLYFQSRADLHLQEGYSGIETPFIGYLETIEDLVDSAVKHRLSRQVLRRIGCAVAGFVSGYYSFAVITPSDEDVDETLRSLRGALVAGLARFIKEALPSASLDDTDRVVW
nr:TetR/AcrR family transcriptional regulator [candidate division Zixibacteria bacterium]